MSGGYQPKASDVAPPLPTTGSGVAPATAFVRCGPNLVINRNEVASWSFESRSYMNGSGPTIMTIVMANGEKHRIEHQAQYLDGADVYKIEKDLMK